MFFRPTRSEAKMRKTPPGPAIGEPGPAIGVPGWRLCPGTSYRVIYVLELARATRALIHPRSFALQLLDPWASTRFEPRSSRMSLRRLGFESSGGRPRIQNLKRKRSEMNKSTHRPPKCESHSEKMRQKICNFKV